MRGAVVDDQPDRGAEVEVLGLGAERGRRLLGGHRPCSDRVFGEAGADADADLEVAAERPEHRRARAHARARDRDLGRREEHRGRLGEAAADGARHRRLVELGVDEDRDQLRLGAGEAGDQLLRHLLRGVCAADRALEDDVAHDLSLIFAGSSAPRGAAFPFSSGSRSWTKPEVSKRRTRASHWSPAPGDRARVSLVDPRVDSAFYQ
jgi:hypothetical protein